MKFQWIREHRYVPAVCDILDTLGYTRQAMHQRLRPLLPDRRSCGFVGRARTFRWMDTNYVVETDPYGLEVEAMDSLKAGDVVGQPDELVFADFDGIVVIPNAVEEKVLESAREKVSAKSDSRKELLAGKTLRKVYNKYGVL